jgi:hypothetical protein
MGYELKPEGLSVLSLSLDFAGVVGSFWLLFYYFVGVTVAVAVANIAVEVLTLASGLLEGVPLYLCYLPGTSLILMTAYQVPTRCLSGTNTTF